MKNEKKPNYVIELEKLQADGALERVNKMIENSEDVWAKRTSGKWQKASVLTMSHGGLKTVVAWYEPNEESSNGDLNKIKTVDTTEFLAWQDEAENSPDAEVIDLAEETARKVIGTLTPPLKSPERNRKTRRQSLW